MYWHGMEEYIDALYIVISIAVRLAYLNHKHVWRNVSFSTFHTNVPRVVGSIYFQS